MPPRKLLLWPLAIAALLAAKPAGAAAITYSMANTMEGNDYANFSSMPIYVDGPGFTLPDPIAGGTVQIGLVDGKIAPPQPDSSNPFVTDPYHGDWGLSGEFRFDLQGHDAAGHPVGPDVMIQCLATMGARQVVVFPTGWNEPYVEYSLSSFSATANRVWCPDGDPVPAALQGLADNLGRIWLTMHWAVDVDKTPTVAFIDLTIDPAPVPEPSTLATMVSALGLAWVYRAKRPRSSRD